MALKNIFSFIPEVKGPAEKKLGFNVKLKWTLIVLFAFFVLANIPLYGLSSNALAQFEFLATILGTDFGSIISLGVGPIVTASIILQLLVGSKILDINTSEAEGRKFFQGIQKILVIVFIVFEASIFVLMKGLEALPGFAPIVIIQLILGGLAIVLMDDLTQKWGFGSGVSLFIGAGISWRLITSTLQFIDQQGRNCLLDFTNTACPGKSLVFIQSLINQTPIEALSAAAAILATVIVFLAVVWAQALKVEIPLSFGRLRGYAVKWPLQFFYASVIPVILTAALVANVQLLGGLLQNWLGRPTIVGNFISGQAVSGFAFWIGSTNLVDLAIRGSLSSIFIIQGLVHVLFFSILAMIFSVFWVKTSGMDAQNQAQKIMSSGLQISGFRQDERVLEAVLSRYVMPLTVMGGLAIGLLASVTDLLGALVGGTAILLVIMIMYQFYQNIAQQHAMDMYPALRKFIKT